MAKIGRPKKEETKRNIIGVRLSEENYNQLMQYATEHGLTITQIVQMALDNLFQGMKQDA